MQIFDEQAQPWEDRAARMADEYYTRANSEFTELYQRVLRDVRTFWYANTDKDGQASLERHADGETQAPTGVELLTAMGTRAQAMMLVAYRRVEHLLAVEADMGKAGQLVDLSGCVAPYELAYNPDGSLQSATLRV